MCQSVSGCTTLQKQYHGRNRLKATERKGGREGGREREREEKDERDGRKERERRGEQPMICNARVNE